MNNQYDKFANFYRELLTNTGHLKKEQNIIKLIIKDIKINSKDDAILDAACGSGEILYTLNNLGYKNISGLDLSENMIKKAKELLPNIKFYNTSWQNINKCQLVNNAYNMVIIVGLSLLHVANEEFEEILVNLKKIVSNCGVLVIDNRKWLQNANNELIDITKNNTYSRICEFNFHNLNYYIEDMCYYIKDRQVVKYKVVSSNDINEFTFDYLRITTNSIVELLYEVGFSKVETKNTEDWPYELIYSYK